MNYFLTLLRSALQLPPGTWLPAWEPVVHLISTPPNLYTYYFILTGWGCSAIQQLKHNQNSLMLIVHSINEHQWSFQILAQETSQSKLLDMLNVQWCPKNNFITSLCSCSWKSSILYSQFNEESQSVFLSFLLVLQRLASQPPGRYKNCCPDAGRLTGSYQ